MMSLYRKLSQRLASYRQLLRNDDCSLGIRSSAGS